jgi:hypothetical protein
MWLGSSRPPPRLSGLVFSSFVGGFLEASSVEGSVEDFFDGSFEGRRLRELPMMATASLVAQ